jgi:hypothetical protein
MFGSLVLKKALGSLVDNLWNALGLGSAAAGGSGGLGFLAGIPLIGSLFGAGAGVQSAGFSSMLNSLPFFAQGGIVPSAAGGWHIPSFADGGMLAKVHGGEMILPKNIADHVAATAGSGGGTTNLIFNGPADAASMDRWYKGLAQRNPSAIRDLFRSNAITPRNS